jgi:uncharacterized membrane protein SirB2
MPFFGVSSKDLVQNILVAVAGVIMYIALANLLDGFIKGKEKIFFFLALVLFVLADKIAKKVAGVK